MKEPTEFVAAGNVGESLAGAPPPATSESLRVMQNTAVVFISRVVGLVFAGAANFLLLRYLGVDRLGQFGAIYAYLSLFLWLASFGVAPLLAREAAQNRKATGSIFYTAILTSAGFAVATAIIALVVSPIVHLDGKLFPLLAIASVEILVLVPIGLPGVIFMVELKQWYSSGFNVARQVAWLVILLGLYLAGAPLVYVILGRLAAAMLEAGLNWYFGHKLLGSEREFLTPTAIRLVKGGLIVTLTTVAAAVYSRIDQVMLHSMVNDHELGHYVAAVRISELLEALPAAFISSLFPLLCVSVSDPSRFYRHLDIGYRYMVLAAAGLSVTFCVGARPIVHLLGGAQYDSSAPLLSVLIWSEMAIFFGSMLGSSLLAAGLQKYALWPTISGAVSNILLNLYFIPRWGALGACWATVISYWTCWTLAFLPFRGARAILWAGLRLLGPITALALAVAGLVFLAPVNDWVRIGMAAVGFSVLACLFGLARKQDLEFLRVAWKTRLGLRGA
jgi:PST family polysaccharide transporter